MTDGRTPACSRRRLLTASATAVATAGLAGCSGDGGGGSDDGSSGSDGATTRESSGVDGGSGSAGGGSDSDGSDGGDSTGSGAETRGLTSVDVPGEAVVDDVDGLDVVETASFEATDHDMVPEGNLAVNVTVENTGGESTRPLDYTTAIWFFDESDEQVNQIYNTVAVDRTVDAGETGVFTTWSRQTPEEVDRYEFELFCGDRADGTYCG